MAFSMTRALRGAAQVLLGCYCLGAMVTLPYYNWQYAKEHGFVSWMFLGQIVPSLKAATWPYFVFVRMREGTPERATGSGPELNASEMERYSRALAKMFNSEMTPADHDEIRSVMRDYTRRTGRYVSRDEYRAFVDLMVLSADYQHELFKSLLLSWDLRQNFTTEAFDQVLRRTRDLKTRKPGLIEADMDALRAAATHRTYVEAGDGTRRAFDREFIVTTLDRSERTKRNVEGMAAIVKEFVR